MIFNAKTRRGVLFVLLIINTQSLFWYFPSGLLAYLQLSLAFFTLLLIFIQFTLRIDDRLITYQVLFCSLVIYQKALDPQQILQLTFKRVSWSTQSAFIQVKKGINLRIIHFYPDNFLKELALFALQNDISINKTKDYLLLEKVEKGSV